MRVAVVGAGQACGPHLRSLEDLASELELAWVVARRREALAALRLPGGTRTSTRLDDILEDATVQAVLVLTPPNTHLDIVQRVALAGKHVLVEKPLEVDLDKARQMVEICERQNVTLAVVLQHRMREASLALARLVDSGAMGKLVGASASIRWWRPQSYYDEPGRGTLARDGGGVLMTQAIHTLDLLLSLTGLPERVCAMARTSPVHRMECEDTVTALLQYPDGAIGSVDATTAAYPGFAERIDLNYTQGSATLEAGALRIALANGEELQVGAVSPSGSGANIMAFDHQAHRAVLQDFVHAVRTGSTPKATGRSALQVQRLIVAMVQSSARGGFVPLS